jgi:hypothetical protein
VTGGGGRERNHRTAAEPLEDARSDEHLEVLCRAGQDRADRERHEPQDEQARQPEAISGPAGEGHDRDVGDEIPIDDPRGFPQVTPVREARIPEDLRQCHCRDHQLDPHEARGSGDGGQEQVARCRAHRAAWWPIRLTEVQRRP